MYEKTDGKMRYLIADSDPVRRGRIIAARGPGVAMEAASLSEAFDMAEAHRPDAVALSADITGEAGLDMFLHLVDALSIALIVYGDHARDRTPQRLKKSIVFVPFETGAKAALLFDAFVKERSGPPDDQQVGSLQSRTTATAAKTPSLIVLGASTGGVSALETVLTSFPVNCPPTLVVQHIRAGFVDGMIKRLDGQCLARIMPAEDALRPQSGHVYIAHDPDRHLVLQPGEPARCRLTIAPARHGHRPSVDALFETVAGRPGVAAALLTGMGKDGAEGLRRIRQGGGLTIAQNEETCVVYGMPKAAVELGAADHVLPLARIASVLIEGAAAKRAPRSSSREFAK
jgi:two-component system chemotaxis response regulator CheB